MLYWLLRRMSAVALRLYYRQIEVSGLERLPRTGPLLLAANHPNALVDALVIGLLAPRRVYLTAKATLFTNPVGGWFLRRAGVIPLRRAKDERAAASVDRGRNEEAFRAILTALARGRAVMIFPEGISHDSPSLAPLRTGLARIALQARDEEGITGLSIVPIGLTFSRKEALRSRILVEVGEPIAIDDWRPSDPTQRIAELTAEATQRLHAVTINFASLSDAEQATALASTLSRLFVSETPSLHQGGPSFVDAAAITRRIEHLRHTLPLAGQKLRREAEDLVAELDSLRSDLTRRGIRADDLGIERDLRSGARFVLRELWVLALGGPVALWGTVNHWLPFRAARAIALRNVASGADPAMWTISVGAGLVLVAYAVQSLVVQQLLGWWAALAYVLSLPLAAEANVALKDRVARGVARARAYLLFRRFPAVHRELTERASNVRSRVARLDQELGALRGANGSRAAGPRADDRGA
jgi:1-acyl-sn-glycerol-3-phosphate acyltransferase